MVLYPGEAGQESTRGATYHVAPAGEFQPGAWVRELDDRDPWHNIMREYNEEFLNAPAARTGSPEDGESPPYSQLRDAIKDKALTRWFLGIGIDPVTLAADLLTACVFERPAFVRIFGKEPWTSIEGPIRPYPFAAAQIERFARIEATAARAMLPGGSALLLLAWEHRAALGLPAG